MKQILKKINPKLAKYILGSVVVVLVLFLLFFVTYSIAYSKKAYKNQFLGDISLGGKNKAEVTELVKSNADRFLNSSIKLEVEKSESFLLDPAEIGLSYNIDETVNQIWSYGREDNIFVAFGHQLSSLFIREKYTAVHSCNEQSLISKIREISDSVDRPEKDYAIKFDGEKFILSTERASGERINQELVLTDLKLKVGAFDASNLLVKLFEYTPQVTPAKAEKRLAEANAVLEQGELILAGKDTNYSMDIASIGGVLESRVKSGDLEIIINEEKTKLYISTLAKNINLEPESAKLKVEEGKVVVIQGARSGKVLDENQTLSDIKNALLSRLPDYAVKADSKKVALKINEINPEISKEVIDSFVNIELVGTAFTNFKGSSASRVHNIKNGASYINGVILKPGETFSTIARLGSIDAAGGYVEGMVIKDNKTVPEYGGGLCQVSSTLFRAAMNAGMKITERSNHKYRVSYYEPPVGMDATIYDPAPDFKFINNFPGHVLIQSKVEGTIITFDIYGHKDGRTATISEPVLTDVVAPEPPEFIETETLAAGQTKRIESAHDGVTSTFNYKVTSATGEILQEKVFRSKYVPWREKWLVGKGTVIPETCKNGVKDGDETAVDFGGSCPRK